MLTCHVLFFFFEDLPKLPLGVGVGAHAHRDGRRWWTTRSTSRYLDAAEASVADRDARDDMGRMRTVTEE